MLKIKPAPMLEMRRKEIINRVKKDHKTRFDKRLNYNVDDIRVSDPGYLYQGDFQIFFKIDKYEATIFLEDYLSVLKRHVDVDTTDLYQKVKKSLSEAVNENDLQVHCTCADFKYRFQYMATQKGYLATPPGQPESRFPDARNPELEGAVCKHLAHLLNYPSEWYPYVAKYVRGMIDFDRSIVESMIATLQEDASITQYSSDVKGSVGTSVHKPADLMSVLRGWMNKVQGEYSINEEASTTVSIVFDINLVEDERLDEYIKELNNSLNIHGYEVSDYSKDRIVISVSS